MKVSVNIEIAKPRNLIWSVITDFEHCSTIISSIIDLQILHQPKEGLIGLKWKETRFMFGKEASEIMWITDAVTDEYYSTRAESHGAVYLTKLSLSESGTNTLLSLSFTAEAQTLLIKIVSAIMGIFIKNSMRKALQKDLEDIKNYLVQSKV